jgi:Fungal chitosanase of glycosyl hydrolase group 75
MTLDLPDTIHQRHHRSHERVEQNQAGPSDDRCADLSRHVQRLFDERGSVCRQNESANRFLPSYPGEPVNIGGDSLSRRSGGAAGQIDSNCSRLMLDASAPPEQRLAAVRELNRAGIDHMTIRGNDGQSYNLRLETEPAGSREMVHLYMTGADGKEHTVLRGVADQNGQYKREQDACGNPVGWLGSGAAKLQAILPSDSAAPPDRNVPDPFALNGQNPFDRLGPDRFDRIGPPLNNDRASPYDRSCPNPYERPNPGPYLRPNPGPYERSNPGPYEGPFQNPYERPYQDPRDDRRFVPPNDGSFDRLRPNPFDQPAEQSGSQWLDRAAQDARNQAKQLVQTSAGIYLRSGMAVDADGSPRARQIDPTGQTSTSMRYADNRSVNAEVVPYMVLPGGAYQRFGVQLGDMVLVRNKDNGKMAVAVFADVGPRNKTGEGSMELAREVGLNPSPTHGGTSRPSIEYLVLPNTHGTKPRNEQELLARIAEQRRQFGIG